MRKLIANCGISIAVIALTFLLLWLETNMIGYVTKKFDPEDILLFIRHQLALQRVLYHFTLIGFLLPFIIALIGYRKRLGKMILMNIYFSIGFLVFMIACIEIFFQVIFL